MTTEPHSILMVTMDNWSLTKGALESVRRLKGIPNVLVLDNSSTDATLPQLRSREWSWIDLSSHRNRPSLSTLWNLGLSYFFDTLGRSHVLVVNNDVLLPRTMYTELLSDGAGFVTGVGDSSESLRHSVSRHTTRNAPRQRRPHPDFSCYMIRRWVWDRVGPFDENFRGAFCEDLDYHVRMHKAGVEAVSINVPYWHYASATVKNADPELRRHIQSCAEANRGYFLRKWGVPVPTPENEGREYYRLFGSDHEAPK